MNRQVEDAALLQRHGGKARVLVASNRLPITATRRGQRIEMKQSSGGLAAGLRHLERDYSVRWFGWSGISTDGVAIEQLHASNTESLVSVPLSTGEIDGYYRGYCNSLLWPVLHGMTDDVGCAADAWQSYVRVNQRFAAAMLADYVAGDRLWIHDYHLLLLPQFIRHSAAGTSAPISFFLHTPFPAPEEFLQIPQHEELLRGILGSDVIGFHTEEYADNFRRVAGMLGHAVAGETVTMPERVVHITARPMGINAEAFGRLGSDADVLEEVKRLRRTHKCILLGVDRLDYTKGIPQRLLAFETLLQERPEMRGEISLLQVAVPTRTETAAYQDLKQVVEQIVNRVNRKYGTAGWTPIEYLYDTVDLNTLAALYRAADVMLVTPARDGLNLVAKEFVATRVDGDGVLVLSKYAGAAKELTAALFVDPNRVLDLAETLFRAITMTISERRSRMRQMMKAVTSNEISDWIGYFIGEERIGPAAVV